MPARIILASADPAIFIAGSSNGRTAAFGAVYRGSNPCPAASFFRATDIYYVYILLSSKSHIFYFGSTINLKKRFELHNSGKVPSTKPHVPWKLVLYGVFNTEKEARDFELYLKSGSGKAFAYKRLVPVALKKDFVDGRAPSA